jgi:hypothetical protein
LAFWRLGKNIAKAANMVDRRRRMRKWAGDTFRRMGRREWKLTGSLRPNRKPGQKSGRSPKPGQKSGRSPKLDQRSGRSPKADQRSVDARISAKRRGIQTLLT